MAVSSRESLSSDIVSTSFDPEHVTIGMSAHGLFDSRRSRIFVVLLIMLLAGFSTRLLPLAVSDFPFNNDSLTEISITGEILRTGHINYTDDMRWNATHSLVTPALDVMLAFLASAAGSTPEDCGQLLGALIALSTIGFLFLLGRMFTGTIEGGIIAAFGGVMLGTFVFTTGSIWKMMLGMNLLLFVVLAFTRRERAAYQILTFLILIIIPLAHHLATAVAFITFAYLLLWSWYYALIHRSVARRHLSDSLVLGIPAAFAAVYYALSSFSRLIEFSSPKALILLASGFLLLSAAAIFILSDRKYVKWSFGPLIGAGVATVAILDYYGFIFSYTPSASDLYLLLIGAFAFMAGLAWYGTEIMIEKKSLYRAVQVGFFMSPMCILGFGVLAGSHQVVYRSFDLLDIFLILGCAVALVHLMRRRRRLYITLSSAFVVLLVVSFPFGYLSGPLLGVRHDTQAYEVDAFAWLEDRDDNMTIITDERLSYIARALYGYSAGPSLPYYLTIPPPFPAYQWYYVMEDSWTTTGVNNYPDGTFVVPSVTYELILAASNVLYVGGPADDKIQIVLASYFGGDIIYPSAPAN